MRTWTMWMFRVESNPLTIKTTAHWCGPVARKYHSSMSHAFTLLTIMTLHRTTQMKTFQPPVWGVKAVTQSLLWSMVLPTLLPWRDWNWDFRLNWRDILHFPRCKTVLRMWQQSAILIVCADPGNGASHRQPQLRRVLKNSTLKYFYSWNIYTGGGSRGGVVPGRCPPDPCWRWWPLTSVRRWGNIAPRLRTSWARAWVGPRAGWRGDKGTKRLCWSIFTLQLRAAA